MQLDDRIRLRHMIEAAEDALRFVNGRVRADLDTDRMLQFAVVRAVEIVGEAASKMSPSMRADHATIPWRVKRLHSGSYRDRKCIENSDFYTC
jgi:uncharacterized protein with HEPN domain